MIVVADTSPLNYLILIDEIDILPRLFTRIIIPNSVHTELQDQATPPKVMEWISHSPGWIEIKNTTPAEDLTIYSLDEGEMEAIQLARDLGADLLLVDEKDARRVASNLGLTTRGTLGILDRAAEIGYLDFAETLIRLKRTSFYLTPSVESFFLKRDALRKSSAGRNRR